MTTAKKKTHSSKDEHKKSSRWSKVDCRVLDVFKEPGSNADQEFAFQEAVGFLTQRVSNFR